MRPPNLAAFVAYSFSCSYRAVIYFHLEYISSSEVGSLKKKSH
jgi:hypothetical protein